MAAVAGLRAFGYVKTIMVLGILANMLYITLECLLIFGAGPIPELGVFGSALATLIVRVTGVLLEVLVGYQFVYAPVIASQAIMWLVGMYDSHTYSPV